MRLTGAQAPSLHLSLRIDFDNQILPKRAVVPLSILTQSDQQGKSKSPKTGAAIVAAALRARF
jgi:hypothetical protein